MSMEDAILAAPDLAEAATESAPAEEAPAAEVPAEKAPAEETPAEEAPATETPVEEAPTEDKPAQEAPSEKAPAEETPIKNAPAEAPVEETPDEKVPEEIAKAESATPEEKNDADGDAIGMEANKETEIETGKSETTTTTTTTTTETIVAENSVAETSTESAADAAVPNSDETEEVPMETSVTEIDSPDSLVDSTDVSSAAEPPSQASADSSAPKALDSTLEDAEALPPPAKRRPGRPRREDSIRRAKEDAANEAPAPETPSRPRRAVRDKKKEEEEEEGEKSADEEPATPSKSRRGRKRRVDVEKSDEASDEITETSNKAEEDKEDAKEEQKPRRRPGRPPKQRVEVKDEPESEPEAAPEEEEPLSGKRRHKPSAKLLEALEAEKAKQEATPSPRKREPGRPMIGKKRRREEEGEGEKTVADIDSIVEAVAAVAKGEDYLASVIADEVAARTAAAEAARDAAKTEKAARPSSEKAVVDGEDGDDAIASSVSAVVSGQDQLARAIAEEVASRAAVDEEARKMVAADQEVILEDQEEDEEEPDDDEDDDETFSPEKRKPKKRRRSSVKVEASPATSASKVNDSDPNYDPGDVKIDVEKPMRPEAKLEFERLLEEGRVCVEEKGGDHSKKIYRCNVCNKIFLAQYTLMRHMPVHTGERRFICPTCGKGFRQASTLCRHKAVHSSDRPFECKLCNKAFNRSSTLIAHAKTHQDDKSHKCPICGKGFHQKGNLKNHIYTHTGERPYACSLCEKRFNQMSNLSFHIASAHLNKSVHKCRLCPEEFRKKPQLVKHEHILHGIDLPRRFLNSASRSTRSILGGHSGTKEGLMKDVVQRRTNFLMNNKEAKRRARQEGTLPSWHRPLNKKTSVSTGGSKTIVTNLPKNITHNKEGYKVVAAIMVGQNNSISVHKAVLDKTGRVVINKEKAKGSEEKELVKGLEVKPTAGGGDTDDSAMDIFKKMVGTQQLPSSIKMELPSEEEEEVEDEVVKMQREAKLQRQQLMMKKAASPKKESGTLVLQQGVLKLTALTKEEKEDMPSVELKLPPGQRMLKVPATISGLAVPEPERMYRVIIAGAGASQEPAPAAGPPPVSMPQPDNDASYMPQLGAPSAQPATMTKEDEREVFKKEPQGFDAAESLEQEPVADLFGFENDDDEEPPEIEDDDEFWPDASMTSDATPTNGLSSSRAGRMTSSAQLLNGGGVVGTPGVLKRANGVSNVGAEARRVRFSIGGDANANEEKFDFKTEIDDDGDGDGGVEGRDLNQVEEDLNMLETFA